MKTYKHLVLLLITLALVAAFSLWFVLRDQQMIWTNDAFVEGFTIDIATNITEEITALFVDEGDSVIEGQTLALFRTDVIDAKIEAQHAQIRTYTDEIEVKKAYFEKLNNDFIRALASLEEKVISFQEFDHAEKNAAMAQAELALATSRLKLAQEELSVLLAEKSHYVVKAPQAATVAKRWVWRGDVAKSGQSLFTLVDLQQVWITANLEETKLEKIRLGENVSIHIDAYPGYTFSGNIFAIKGSAASQFSLIPQNNATGNFTKVAQRIPIKISLIPPKELAETQPLFLFPGMSAEVSIQAGS